MCSCTDDQVGDEVVFHGDLKRQGGLAQYVVTKSSALSHKPKSLSHVQAASIPCAGYTAYQVYMSRDLMMMTGHDDEGTRQDR